MNPAPKSPEPTTHKRWDVRVRFGLLRYSMAWFLGALVVLIVTVPFVQEFQNFRYIEAALVSVVLTLAVLAVGGRRKTLAVAIVLAAPTIAGRWLYHFQAADKSFAFYIGCFLVFIGFVVFQFLRFMLRSPRVTSEVLCAVVATYIMLGLLWASAYMLVARLSPGAFSGLSAGQSFQGFNALYFSLITLTTIGYGDIVPVSSAARMLAMMEGITGTMYVAVLISRLVALYTSESASEVRK